MTRSTFTPEQRADLGRILGHRADALIADLDTIVRRGRAGRAAPRMVEVKKAVRGRAAELETHATACLQALRAVQDGDGLDVLVRDSLDTFQGPGTLTACVARLQAVIDGLGRVRTAYGGRRGVPVDDVACWLTDRVADCFRAHRRRPARNRDGQFAETLKVVFAAARVPAGDDLLRSRLRRIPRQR